MKQLDFPKLRQAYEYDCGAIVLESILTYYGIELCEELLMKSAKTNKKRGTSSSGILKTLKKYGLQFEEKSMSVEDLKKFILKKIPVIILLQAWNGKSIDYTNDFNDGHWVVIIGYDGKKIIFEDPYSFERTFLTEKELGKRWHSKEGKKKLINYGIAVYGKKPGYNSKKIVHMD